MKLARNLLLIVVLLLTGAALMYVIEAGSGLSLMPDKDISHADFISIILTALGVILAALALVLGGLAIVGWATFEEKLKQNSDEFLRKRFSPEDQRYVDLINEIKEDVRREIQLKSRRRQDLENNSPFDPDAV
jgi:divalent metal cation (Fe/Co/Zn/Cd) transporter